MTNPKTKAIEFIFDSVFRILNEHGISAFIPLGIILGIMTFFILKKKGLTEYFVIYKIVGVFATLIALGVGIYEQITKF